MNFSHRRIRHNISFFRYFLHRRIFLCVSRCRYFKVIIKWRFLRFFSSSLFSLPQYLVHFFQFVYFSKMLFHVHYTGVIHTTPNTHIKLRNISFFFDDLFPITFYYHSVRFTLQCQLQYDQIRASVVRIRVKLCNCKCSHHVALFISTISIHSLFSATPMLSMCSHRSLSYFGKVHYGFKIYKFCIYT